ncbi:MAG: acyltransferase [Candidatus Omnitrophica bacterium]|nr:acyltransferase [Candidatus Omnitrophota bacterium]
MPPLLHGRVNTETDAIAETAPLTSGPAYLNSLNYFRGLAILFIIAGHCFQLSGWHVDAFYEKMIVNLIKGGTAFFVFISGFLFHHIFAPHFRYRRFMKKKLSNVLQPYVVVSALPLMYYVLIRQGGPHADLIYSGGQGLWAQYLQPVLKYLWTGRLFDAYWYVPFIMVVFALSPVVLAYLRLPLRARLSLLGGTLVIALLIHRPLHNISVAQSVIYFLPVYLLGINISLDQSRVLKHLTGKEWLLALGMLGLAAFQVAYYANYTNLHKPAFEWAGLDILLIQKMLGCLFFFVMLNRFENRHWPWLKTLATSSFALYFLHPPVILLIKKSGVLDLPLLHQIPGIVAWGLWCGVVTAVSFGLALAIRKCFQKYSRRVIGW